VNDSGQTTYSKGGLTALLISATASIRSAIECLDRNAKGIVLVTTEDRRLLGTVTDGDIRRAILSGTSLDLPVQTLLDRRGSTLYPHPTTAPVGTPTSELIRLMNRNSIRHVPLLDEQGRLVDLVLLNDLVEERDLPVTAVVMAGGFGNRLRPLTEDLPKPMLPVGGRPLIERIFEQLLDVGVREINVMTHYKPERIIEHFGDGHAFGVKLSYVTEDRPLGTGGALALLPTPRQTLLVINGDILTQVDFRAMLSFHQEHGSEMTVAVRRYEIEVPYGVVECEGAWIRALKEKPQLGFLVNAGIYLLEPSVFDLIPNGKRFNMTDLIGWLLDKRRAVISFPIREYWLDIGQPADYVQAQTDVTENDPPT
jgi:dTDP-glucose pyrophosphorylase/CBS domain-containing protein